MKKIVTHDIMGKAARELCRIRRQNPDDIVDNFLTREGIALQEVNDFLDAYNALKRVGAIVVVDGEKK